MFNRAGPLPGEERKGEERRGGEGKEGKEGS